jgi:hypothetical protein
MRKSGRILAFTAAAALLALAGAAAAHPGHGLDGGSFHWLHFVSDPLHVAPLAAGAAAGVLAWRARRRVRARSR